MLSHIIGPSPKKKVAPSDKVPPSEEVEKGTNLLNYIDNIKLIGNYTFQCVMIK